MKEKNRFDWAKEVDKLRTYPGLMGESKGETFRAWWLTDA